MGSHIRVVFGFGLRHITVLHLILGSHTLKYNARVFEMLFPESTLTYAPIWLAQNMRNKNPDLMVQSDWAKSDRASQKTQLKNSSSNVCEPKTKCRTLMCLNLNFHRFEDIFTVSNSQIFFNSSSLIHQSRINIESKRPIFVTRIFQLETFKSRVIKV